VITADLLRAIVGGYSLHLEGVHGLAHWARVCENGRKLAAVTGADLRVVELFAIFHDARRRNEGHDPGHGRRGALLAAKLRGRHFELDDQAFALLVEACELHTDGRITGDITLRTCWDADRLDLRRCSIVPDPARLATDAARDPAVLAWADRRASTGFQPPLLNEVWRPLLDGRRKR
jgi:uncharacterized protein